MQSMMIKKQGKLSFDGPTIIYCPTKKATEEVDRNMESKYNPYR